MSHDNWLVARWMSKKVLTVESGSSLADAFEIMQEHRIRHIPVVDRGRLVGIVSDRDIRPYMPTRTQLEEGGAIYGEKLISTKIDSVMTRRPLTATKEWTIRDAAETVCREKIGALPITGNDGLVGIITTEDLLWAFVDNIQDLKNLKDL